MRRSPQDLHNEYGEFLVKISVALLFELEAACVVHANVAITSRQ